jgi:hypothetical protein
MGVDKQPNDTGDRAFDIKEGVRLPAVFADILWIGHSLHHRLPFAFFCNAASSRLIPLSRSLPAGSAAPALDRGSWRFVYIDGLTKEEGLRKNLTK